MCAEMKREADGYQFWRDMSLFIGVPASLCILGVIMAYLLVIAQALGNHTRALDTLDRGTEEIKGAIARLDDQVSRESAEIKRAIGARLDRIEASMNATKVDYRDVLVNMGIVGNDDVFTTVVYNDAVWLLPGGKVIEALEGRGYKLKSMTPLLQGFEIIPVSAVKSP